MKYKILIIILLVASSGYGQDRRLVKKAFSDINLELTKEYVEAHEGTFDNSIKNSKQLYKYIERMYPSKEHCVNSAFLNLNSCSKQYKKVEDSISASEHINNSLSTHVKYDFDQSKIDSIISYYFPQYTTRKKSIEILGKTDDTATARKNDILNNQPIKKEILKSPQNVPDDEIVGGLHKIDATIKHRENIPLKTTAINNPVDAKKETKAIVPPLTKQEKSNAINTTVEHPKFEEINESFPINAPNKNSVEISLGEAGTEVTSKVPAATAGTEETAVELNEKLQSDNVLLLIIMILIGYIVYLQLNKKTVNVQEKSDSEIDDIEKPSIQSQSSAYSSIEDPKRIKTKSQLKDWVVAHTSQIGKSHLSSKPTIPCQDNHAVKSLPDGWGIAISCDGAGSASMSHKGSKFVAKKALDLFNLIISKNNWIQTNSCPTDKQWETICFNAFKQLYFDLEVYANSINLNIKQLATTVIVMVYSPDFLLVSHIGDGRAGYRNLSGEWKPCLSPHKGEEANQTIFLTSTPWLQRGLKVSSVNVPESIVIRDSPSAFTLMSDGCESHAFETGYFNKEKQLFIEKNMPFSGFFEPLVKTLKNMKKDNLSNEEIISKWDQFIATGNEKLQHEPDDKTIILGVTF